MLYPEVSNLKPSRHYISTELRDSKRQKPPSELKTSYFNHSVCFVLPDTAHVPDSLRAELTEDTDYYRIDSVAATEFLDKGFIEAFVKHGELTALSIGNRIDVDNCIGLCPSGELLLSLVTEDYHQLGLEGSPSFFARGSPNRYVVRIDLKAADFVPGRKRYDDILRALENRLDQTFDVILAWNPPEERTCPSSAAAWFHDRGYKVSLCRAKYHGRSEYSVAVPLLADARGSDHKKIFEWIGAFSIAGDLSTNKEEAEEYVSSYKCPVPSAYVGQVQYLQWSGLFTRKQIRKMYHAVEKYHPTPEHEGLWSSFHVQGFADAIVSFSSKEHNYYTDGDSSLTILFQQNGKYVVQKSLSSSNKPRGRP